MDLVRALEIVRNLANGVDPFTGEEFPDDSLIQHPEIIRALFYATEGLVKLQRIGARPKMPCRAGEPWTMEEQTRLVKAFDSGRKPAELAILHQRTVGAITSRLAKLGKLIPEPSS